MPGTLVDTLVSAVNGCTLNPTNDVDHEPALEGTRKNMSWTNERCFADARLKVASHRQNNDLIRLMRIHEVETGLTGRVH